MVEEQKYLSKQRIVEQFPPKFELFAGLNGKPVAAYVSRNPGGHILLVVPGTIVQFDQDSLPARYFKRYPAHHYSAQEFRERFEARIELSRSQKGEV